MVNAVILAGGKREEYIKRDNWIYRTLLKYGRRIPGEEKAVMIYRGKPMIKWVIGALKNAKSIDDLVVVGNTIKLEESGINDVVCLEQSTTITQNAMIGYIYFKERGQEGRTLFVPCDIPEISGNTLDGFVEKAKDGDFCFAMGDKKFLGEYDKFSRRFYIWAKKEGVRKRYRWSNLALVKPEAIKNKDMVEYAFSLRNILDIRTWPKIAKVIGYKPFFDWATFRLDLGDVERRISEKFGCDFRVVEICDPSASFDLDYKNDPGKVLKWYQLRNSKV